MNRMSMYLVDTTYVAPTTRRERKQKNNGFKKKKSKRARKVAKHVMAFKNDLHVAVANARKNLTNDEMDNAYAELMKMFSSDEKKHKGLLSNSDSSSDSE